MLLDWVGTARFLMLLVCLLLMGCKQVILPGSYEGILEAAENASKSFTEVVDIGVVKGPHRRTQVNIYDKTGNKILYLEFVKTLTGKVKVKFPKLREKSFLLTKQSKKFNEEETCFSDNSEFNLTACFDKTDFHVDFVQDGSKLSYHLRGGQFKSSQPIQYEDSLDYTQDELIQLALKSDFNSKIELQRLIQARDRVTEAYLNLVPHVRFSTIMAVPNFLMTKNPFAIVGEIGNLAPFLLPNRIFKVKEASLKAKAQEAGFHLMEKNSAVQIEGMIYTLKSQEEIVKIYGNAEKRAEDILQKVLVLEDQKRIKEGTADTLKTLVRNLENSRNDVKRGVRTSRVSLSQSLGLLNPDAVGNVSLDRESVYMNEAQPLDVDRVVDAAVERSLELNQLKYLIKYAKTERAELFFIWMDPLGNFQMSLGLNMIPQCKIAKSEIKILEDRYWQTKKQIIDKATSMVLQYNSMKDEYDRAHEFLRLQEGRLDRVLKEVLAADLNDSNGQLVKMNANHVQMIFQDYVSSAILLDSYLTTFRIARSQIERLTYITGQSQLIRIFEPTRLQGNNQESKNPI
jgi:hypothetical protein